jgi:hydroxyacylglutathione hydrolase
VAADIVPVPQLSDNYAYLIVDHATGEAGVVDCAEAPRVLDEAGRRKVRLRAALATHHHFDHVGGNLDLLSALPGLRVYGSDDDAPRIPGITDRLRDGDRVPLGGLDATVIMIPAHTSGHVAYHFPAEQMVFTGDTLFAGGCGRLFEGDAAQMMASLARLADLPDETRVYCGAATSTRRRTSVSPSPSSPGTSPCARSSRGSSPCAARASRPCRAPWPRSGRRTPSSAWTAPSCAHRCGHGSRVSASTIRWRCSPPCGA